jgi:hypothetical protein
VVFSLGQQQYSPAGSCIVTSINAFLQAEARRFTAAGVLSNRRERLSDLLGIRSRQVRWSVLCIHHRAGWLSVVLHAVWPGHDACAVQGGSQVTGTCAAARHVPPVMVRWRLGSCYAFTTQTRKLVVWPRMWCYKQAVSLVWAHEQAGGGGM